MCDEGHRFLVFTLLVTVAWLFKIGMGTFVVFFSSSLELCLVSA